MEKSNQWELNGDCSLCRRKEYCSKQCTRRKRRTTAVVSALVKKAIDRKTGGVLSEMVNRLKEE